VHYPAAARLRGQLDFWRPLWQNQGILPGAFSMLEPQPSIGIHGFTSWPAFFKASLSLGLTVGGILYTGLLFGLDQRYAAKGMELVTTQLVADVRATREKILAGQIFELRAQECTGAAPETRRVYAERLVELESDYQKLTGVPFRIHACETFR